DAGQTVAPRGAQPGPRHETRGSHAGVGAGASHQRVDTVGSDIAILTIELRGAGHTEPVTTEPRGHDLGFFVEQADPWCALHALFVIEMNGDRIALHRVHVQPVSGHGRQLAAAHAATDHDGIKFELFHFTRDPVRGGVEGPHLDTHLLPGEVQCTHLTTIHEAHPLAFAGLCQTPRELVDVAG